MAEQFLAVKGRDQAQHKQVSQRLEEIETHPIEEEEDENGAKTAMEANSVDKVGIAREAIKIRSEDEELVEEERKVNNFGRA